MVNCAISKKPLAGTSKKAKSKESKTQRRPSVPFGGVLGGRERGKMFIELGKVLAKIKTIDEVDQKYRKYVKQAMKRAE